MNILITGITGSLGKAVTKILTQSKENHQILGYSRDEYKQALFRNEFPRVTLYLGDVRNRDRLLEASRKVDVIFHFAALKHVDKLEHNPEEAIDTNILGTKNVLHAQRLNSIPRVVLSATDKGVYPINVYGATKLIAERLVLRNPNNVVCRYGNVLASRGSVVERLVETLVSEKKVYLTDPNMSRFWVTLKEAAEFVVSSSHGEGGLKIPTMRAASLQVLSQSVANVMGIKSYEMVQIGHRPGEKLIECLKNEYELSNEDIFSHQAPQYSPEALEEELKPIIAELI